ncbi:MAG TPA: peptidoglycan-associated lipoprotein, partial [Alteromonas macleodii]|nr:peptidoglycan-associated lipoprotein [Alteromonas macleodii]HBN98299.1 peptidoglycan-associated lipoprotein [Alteromonas macleodii]
ALGERRAQSVETYLLNAGVSSSQVTVVSYGEEKPAVMGSTEYAFAQNRRGVVVYR